jgi:hypothetical protein
LVQNLSLLASGSKLRRFQEFVESFWGFPPVLFFGRGIFQVKFVNTVSAQLFLSDFFCPTAFVRLLLSDCF